MRGAIKDQLPWQGRLSQTQVAGTELLTDASLLPTQSPILEKIFL